MGERSESLYRQTLLLLGQNAQLIPPGYDLAEAQHDLATYDLLHSRFSRLQQLISKAEDTEVALGSNILIAALEGYALAKAIGRGAGLDTLKETMATRFSGRRRATRPATKSTVGAPARRRPGIGTNNRTRPARPPTATARARSCERRRRAAEARCRRSELRQRRLQIRHSLD